jgi:hypothetical protein
MNKDEMIKGVWTDIGVFRRRLDPHLTQWRRNLAYYHGRYDIDDNGKRRVITNLVFGLANRIIPSVYYKNPYVLASPRGDTPREFSKLIEAIANLLINTLSVDMEMRRVVFDSLFRGIGIVKVGMAPKVGDEPPIKAGYSGVSQEQLLEALMIAQQYVQGQPPSEATNKELAAFRQNVGFRENVQPNQPFFLRVHPAFLVPDRYATCIDNARWVAHRILLPEDEFKKRDYDQDLVAGIHATHGIDDSTDLEFGFDTLSSIGQEPEGGKGDLVELWELWHKPTRTVYILSDQRSREGDFRAIEERDWPYDFDEFPFEDLRFNANPDNWFGIADVSTWDSMVTGYNFVQTMQLRHVNRATPKMVINEADYNEQVDEALRSTEDMALAVVPQGAAASAIVPLQLPALTGEVYVIKRDIRDDLTFVSGVTYQRQGFQTKGETTATEVASMENNAMLRDNDRMYLVAKFMERSMRKVVQLCRQNMSLGDVAFLSGSAEQSMAWKTVAAQLNRAEVDLIIRVGSTAFQTKETRISNLLELLNYGGKLVDPMTGQSLLNVREVLTRIAEELVDDPESLIVQPVNPLGGAVPVGGGGPIGGPVAGAPGLAGMPPGAGAGPVPGLPPGLPVGDVQGGGGPGGQGQ